MKSEENLLNNFTELSAFLSAYNAFNEKEEFERLSFLQFLEAFGGFAYVRDNLVGHITVSAWIVNPKCDKVLMAFHNLYKFWAWPGGHADGNSDLSEVIIREIKEETSLQNFRLLSPSPVDLAVLGVAEHYKNGKFVPQHLHYNLTYWFTADENQVLQAKPDENSGVQWLTFAEMEKYCHNDQVFPCYQRIMKKTQKIS